MVYQKVSTYTTQFTTVYDKKDGYLLSTRGNPLRNVVRDGKKVMLHSATGKDFEVPVLKQIMTDGTWKSVVAMDKVKKHNKEWKKIAQGKIEEWDKVDYKIIVKDKERMESMGM